MTGGTYASSPPFRSTRTTSTTGAGDSTEHLSSSRDNIWRQRARSLTAVLSGDGSRPSGSSALDVLAPFGMSPTSTSDILSVSSTDDPMSASFGFTAHSLPVHFFPINGNYIYLLIVLHLSSILYSYPYPFTWLTVSTFPKS